MPPLDFVDRLVVLTGDLKPCRAELDLILPRARCLSRPVDPHRLIDALRWISRYADDQDWVAVDSADGAWVSGFSSER